MRELSTEELIKGLTVSNRDLLFIASPNFESRSIKCIDLVRQIDAMRGPSRMRVGLMNLLNNAALTVMLDNLSGFHFQQAKQEFQQKEQQDMHFTLRTDGIRYPNGFSRGDLDGVIRRWLHGLSSPASICFDITALPRRVIIAAFGVLMELSKQKKIDQLFITYTWAKRYPRAGRPASLGGLIIAPDNTRMSSFLDPEAEVKSVLIAGRESFAGRLFLDSLPPRAQVDAYVHLSKDEPLSALKNVYANSGLFAAVESKSSSSVNYFLSVARGHRMLVDNARRAVNDWERLSRTSNRCYLVAPFGNKPSLVSAFIASKIASSSAKAGIVVTSQHQYGDMYSVGWRQISHYEVSLDELRGHVS